MRLARQYVWVSADDCFPPHSLDMNWKHDADKVAMLVNAFKQSGFDKTKPALVGYPLNGKIQLLSGTHRHEAAKLTGQKLPVTLWLRDSVMRRWGTELWLDLIKDIPVCELEQRQLTSGIQIEPYDPVEL